mgnify:CR=1 FL=1
MVSCGMRRRRSFTGGSVSDMMISSTTTVAPLGCQSRLNERMNSTTTRAINNNQNTNSAKPRISKKSAN